MNFHAKYLYVQYLNAVQKEKISAVPRLMYIVKCALIIGATLHYFH